MTKKKKPSTPGEKDSVGSEGSATQPSISSTSESQELKLSEAQRQTILKYAKLPAHLSERLTAAGPEEKGVHFTLDELDELLDEVEGSVYRAKGNERQKVLRIAEKVSKLLGSNIDVDEMPSLRSPTKTAAVFQIKITLKVIYPRIWRRIRTTNCTLEQLHAIIQIAMGWEFDHLYRFDIGGVEFNAAEFDYDDEAEDATVATLSDVLPVHNRRPRFEYEYDFGDGWIHQLIVEERLPPEPGANYPICIAGERACPPEDCGGPWSYSDFVEAISNPNHKRHDEILEWAGEFDPEKFDLDAVNKQLRRMWKKSRTWTS